MEDFKGFNLEQPEQPDEQQEVKYESSLGDYTFPQETLILFGRSKEFALYTLLNIFAFFFALIPTFAIITADLTYTQNGVTVDLGYLRFILIPGVIIAAFIPVLLGMIWIGSLKKKIQWIETGAKGLRIYVTIGLVLAVIAVVFLVIGTLMMLVYSFIFAIFFGVFMGVFMYFYIKWLDRLKNFFEDLEYSVRSTKNVVANTEGLTGFMWALIILTGISFIGDLITGGQASNQATGMSEVPLANVLDSMYVHTILTNFLSIVILLFSIYLIDAFRTKCVYRRRPQ